GWAPARTGARGRHPLGPDAFDRYAFDLPGFGLCRDPGAGLDDLVSAACAAIHHVAAAHRPPVVVGSSLGGHVAMLAALAGAPLSGLCLLAPGGLFHVTPALRAATLATYDADRLVSRSEEEVVLGARRLFAAPHPEAERLAARKLALHRSSLCADYMRPFARIVGEVLDRQVGADVSRIQVPMLFVSGTADCIVPPPVVQAAARRTGQPFVAMPHTGHVPMLEAPERLWPLVSDFARKCLDAQEAP
ncbi:MAG: alpha/beta hydrolase, partial [Deltaproteobacteria bacterium]